jgi:chromate transport protein ChrA
MFKKLKKTALNLCLVIATIITMLVLSLLAIDFSTIILILIGGCIGLSIFLVKYFKERSSNKDNLTANDKDKEDKD